MGEAGKYGRKDQLIRYRKISIVKTGELLFLLFFISENLQKTMFRIYLNTPIYPNPSKTKISTMKNISPLTFFISDNSMKVLNKESLEQPAQSKSPYLKAILSGTAISPGYEKELPVQNPDHAAALRYIKESALLKK